MLKQNFHKSPSTLQTLATSNKLFHSYGSAASFGISQNNFVSAGKSRKLKVLKSGNASTGVKALFFTHTDKTTTVKAKITVLKTVGGVLKNLGLAGPLDGLTDLLRRSLQVELVAAELDPKTGQAKKTIKAYAGNGIVSDLFDNEIHYKCSFEVPAEFGTIGAILIENQHIKEMYVKSVALDGVLGGPANISCNSWISPEKRIFFSNKSYLPSQTPDGLKLYREKELTALRGDGKGERKHSDRIYDYDVYNDLGDPDKNAEAARPVLGGAEHPYPRRCRTGRPKTKKDPLSESRGSAVSLYVPRDEAFSEVKLGNFGVNAVYSVAHALVPSLETILDPEKGFPNFTEIDALFDHGIDIPGSSLSGLLSVIPSLVKSVADAGSGLLKFETPELIDRDKFSWYSDTEFARQTLAGVNPFAIKLVTEWPITSKLDPSEYGPAESSITKELVEKEIGGIMSLEEAIEQKKLFIIDYHDLLLPYVNKVREIKGTTFYGSRALFYLTEAGTLSPLAIELTRPPVDGKPQWRQVFDTCSDATGLWLWRLAKAHFLAHDSSYHQLVSHWLRTHCCTEPYIIASNRQLSAMHPIYRLLDPHFRYTMEINALAREALINEGGIFETTFAPRKYSVELSSAAYDQQWRFDLDALPADLISRGLAVEDPTAPHGLKLTIADYPYANDGLLIWDAIKEWVTEYVKYYYPEASLVLSDNELQQWWTEIKTVGHGDKKDEPWWPELKSSDDLIGILTTIIWVASGHHAAVNFGQYDFAGYFPNRPTVARKNMPTEEPKDEEKAKFLERPEKFLLDCFPSKAQATKVMALLDVLSNHSTDEEYIGGEILPFWAENEVTNAAFVRFSGRLKEIEGIIDARNADLTYKNRAGAGVVPYELLKPYSESGVTGKGIPNSISI